MAASYNAATLFTLNAGGYTAGAQQIARANREIRASQESVARSSSQMGGKMGKATAFVSQVGYGVEDFALGFQTGGLQGAMRGASNNMSMMAMAAGGLLGALLALATTVATQVIPAISKLAQSTTTFQGLGKTLDSFKRRMEISQKMRDINRSAGEAMRSFDKTADAASALQQIGDQDWRVKMSQQDLKSAKKDLQDMRNLRKELVQEDQDEGSRQGLLRRAMAGFTPYLAEVWAANTGQKKPNYWNNTKEIRESFEPIERELEQRVRQAELAEVAQRNVLNHMRSQAPGILENDVAKGLDQARQAMEKSTSQGLGWADAYEREVTAIKDKAVRDAEEIRRTISKPSDQRKMIAEVERARDLKLEMAEKVFTNTIAERLAEAEKGLLDPLSKRLQEINQEAQNLKKEAAAAPVTEQERAEMFRRIEEWQKGAEEKAKKEAVTGRSSGSLQSIMAGSDQVFATVRQQEVELLKKIASNTDGRNLAIAQMV